MDRKEKKQNTNNRIKEEVEKTMKVREKHSHAQDMWKRQKGEI